MISFIQSFIAFSWKVYTLEINNNFSFHFLWVAKNMEYILWQWVDRIYGKLHAHL